MNHQSALSEFAALLLVGAGALEDILTQPTPELRSYIDELNGIATRLREISDGIAGIAVGEKR